MSLFHHVQYANPKVSIKDVEIGVLKWNVISEENVRLLQLLVTWLMGLLGDVTRNVFRALTQSITQQISGNV